MIQRAISAAVLLVVLHCAVVAFLLEPILRSRSWFPVVPTSLDQNRLAAENYLHSGGFQTVIVGSSLSKRIDASVFPGACNLALEGRNALDGLAVIQAATQGPPRLVLVEMNEPLIGAPSAAILSEAAGPPWYGLRTRFAGLRNHYRPALLATTLGLYALTRAHLLSDQPNDVEQEGGRAPDQTLYERYRYDQERAYQRPPSVDVLRQRLAALTQALNTLRLRNVRVAAFEMPVSRALCDSPRVGALRHYFARGLEKEGVPYLASPPCAEEFETSDGIHLTESAGRRYTAYLARQVAALP